MSHLMLWERMESTDVMVHVLLMSTEHLAGLRAAVICTNL